MLAAPYKAIIACIAYTCTTNLSNCLGAAVVLWINHLHCKPGVAIWSPASQVCRMRLQGVVPSPYDLNCWWDIKHKQTLLNSSEIELKYINNRPLNIPNIFYYSVYFSHFCSMGLHQEAYLFIHKQLNLLAVKKFSSTVQSFYNTPHYNMDLDIKRSCGSQNFLP